MGWNGPERRAVQLADETSRSNGPTIDIPTVVLVVGFVAVVLLQLGALWGHGVLDHHGEDEAKRSAKVDESLTCYVVKLAQGTAGPDALSDCGFLTVATR